MKWASKATWRISSDALKAKLVLYGFSALRQTAIYYNKAQPTVSYLTAAALSIEDRELAPKFQALVQLKEDVTNWTTLTRFDDECLSLSSSILNEFPSP
jgi:hypothetical protein